MHGSASRRHVVVVGGGVVGCMTAYQLARAGFPVTLVERDAIAAHASGRNAGNLNPLVGTPPALGWLAIESFRIHQRIGAELAQLGYATATPARRLHLGFDERERAALEEIVGLHVGVEGFSAVWLTQDDMRRLEPGLSADVTFGLLTQGALTLDGEGFTRSLADAATKLGARIVHDTVLGVSTAGEQVLGVETCTGVIACDEAVFATGPWVAELGRWLGVEPSVRPMKGEILLVRLPGATPRHDLTWGSTSLYRRREGETWVGVTSEDCGFDATPSAEAKSALLGAAARIWPDIGRAEPFDHFAALRPVTPSGLPIAGRAPGWRNAWIANGGGSKGMLLSAGIAQILCGLLLGAPDQVAEVA